MQTTRPILNVLLGVLVAGCAGLRSPAPAPRSASRAVSPAARAELASTGNLRVGLILSNQVLVTKDPGTGELRGVTIDLGRALAQRLGVPLQTVGYANPGALVKSFGADEWDIAFLAFDASRARDVEFSPPYMEVDNTYLVTATSRIATVDLADQAGLTIAVPEKSAPDLFLTRNLQSAKVLRVPGGAAAAIESLKSGKADAYAENAHMLSLYAELLPGARVLQGRYTVIQHAIATPKGRPAAADAIKAFVQEVKANGTVADAIRAGGLRGTRVAPASPTK